MTTETKLYLFEVDDILYPRKDFILQIYYLFAQFVAFTEAKAIEQEMVLFMKKHYEEYGESKVLESTFRHYDLADTYLDNFERLQANGHLPLKLHLFPHIKTQLENLRTEGIPAAILTKGNPVLQLNKLKHIDWEGREKYLKIYFWDELTFRNIEPFKYIAKEFTIGPQDITYIR